MRVTEHPFSDLLRSPNRVVADLDDGDVLLRRRDAPALRHCRADREDERTDAFEALARLLRNVAVQNPAIVRDGTSEAFPWVEFLPTNEREVFVAELTTCLVAAASLDNLTPVAQLLAEWRATAEVHADAPLARRLQTEVETDGGQARRRD